LVSRPTRRPDVHGDLLEVEGLAVRLPGEARPILDGLELRLEPGTVAGVRGRSGCGKTTLLGAVSGLVPWLRPAEVRGEVRMAGESLTEIDPGQRAHLIGTCLDRPDAQLFLPTVGHELDAARRLHGNGASLERAAEALGVTRLAGHRVTELSSGQRQRVALAAALAASPRPVLLDEPTAHLDAEGVAALLGLLGEVAAEGGSCLLNEQSGWRLAGSVGRWLQLGGGVLEPCPVPVAPRFPAPAPAEHRAVLTAAGLTVERGGRTLLSGIDLELRAGEIVLLTGANGAGKSTLAGVLAGLRRPRDGVVRCDGRSVLMLPSAELQLFAGTVAGEVGASEASNRDVARVLRRHRLEHLAARAPWTLSRGERQRLVHAALDLQRPAVMIVDEPAQGLDPEDLESFIELVHRRAAKGRAYLVISHRVELAAAAHRHLAIAGGRLEEVAP
jgi:energy-coupling factor transport system ATP-binding protein